MLKYPPVLLLLILLLSNCQLHKTKYISNNSKPDTIYITKPVSENDFRAACSLAQNNNIPIIISPTICISLSNKPIIIEKSLKIIGGCISLNNSDLFMINNSSFLDLNKISIFGARNIITIKDYNLKYGFYINNSIFNNCASLIKTYHDRSNSNVLINGIINKCQLVNFTNIAISVKESAIRKISIENCLFTDMRDIAIQIGNGVFNSNNKVKNIKIRGNRLENIVSTNIAKGIEITGADSVLITDNTILNCTSTARKAASGIYIKATNTIIKNNYIHNSGYILGSIESKGGSEGKMLEQRNNLIKAESHHILITENYIIFTSNTSLEKGISTQNENIKITNNTVINSSLGIEIIPTNKDNKNNDNEIIQNNIFSDIIKRKEIGINLSGTINGLKVNNNNIYLNSDSLNIGILLKSTTANNVDIKNNYIKFDYANYSKAIGINLLVTNENNKIIITNNKIMNCKSGISVFPYDTKAKSIYLNNFRAANNSYINTQSKIYYSTLITNTR